MNLSAYNVPTQTSGNESHFLVPNRDAEEALLLVRNFLSLQPSKRWMRSDVSEEKNHHHQIRGYGGRGTWERFRATARAEHLWWAQKNKHGRTDSPPETWSILDKHDAPPGWGALDEVDAYIEGADACGGISECITVRDRDRADGIAGFVVYGIVLYAEIMKQKRKRTPRTISFDLYVDVRQIYVRPPYRRKKFGLALCFGLSERLKRIVEHGLSTQSMAHKFLINDITLSADCYSEEGYEWMATLDAEVDFWVASAHCGHALESTSVTGEFGL